MIIPELKEFITTHDECYYEPKKMFFDDPRMPKYLELYEKYSNQPFDVTVYPLDNEQYAKKLVRYIRDYEDHRLMFLLVDGRANDENYDFKVPKEVFLEFSPRQLKHYVKGKTNLVISNVQDDDPKYDGISFYETNRDYTGPTVLDVLKEDLDGIKSINEFFDYLASKRSENDEEILKYILSCIDKASAIVDEVMAQLPEKTISPLPDSVMSEYGSLIRQQRDISSNDLKTKLRASLKEG